MKLSALRLHVHRLERAADFYGTRLGLPLRVDGRRQGWCVFDLGGGVDLVVEAVAPDADEDEQALVGRPTGVSFAVDDIQAAQQALAARGVPFASAPERQAWGGWTTSFEDPDGNALQLVQHPSA
ncbi:MAG: VOC family protein [Rubrivivax sp.]|jgi:catechol 2,3-dioxygenase-like lactoylglutathione lyase family enzyme|nr:VOC family protein [Rubrivivax sp.]